MRAMKLKSVGDLTVADLEEFPIWQYSNDDGAGEMLVQPVKRLPVAHMAGRVVGCQLTLASGVECWGLLGNIDLKNAVSTQHFITVSVERSGKWFALARYHDFDYIQNGPAALAAFLGMAVSSVFPISYNISSLAKGDKDVVVNTVPELPIKTLTRREIIELAVPNLIQ